MGLGLQSKCVWILKVTPRSRVPVCVCVNACLLCSVWHSFYPDWGLCLDPAALVGSWPITRAHTTWNIPRILIPNKLSLPMSLKTVSTCICSYTGHILALTSSGTITLWEICYNDTPTRRQATSLPESSLFLHPCPYLVLRFLSLHLIFDHILSPFYFWVIDSMAPQHFWTWTPLETWTLS